MCSFMCLNISTFIARSLFNRGRTQNGRGKGRETESGEENEEGKEERRVKDG